MPTEVSWTALDPGLRARLDELLCRRSMIWAIKLLREECGQDPRPGLDDARIVLYERTAELRRQGLVDPEPPPPTTAQLIAKAETVTEPIAAVEAVWDGDTQGWYVYLAAIVRRDHDHFGEVTLGVLRDGNDSRLFTGEAPPWTEAESAAEKGEAVARHFGVPFFFASPDEPDINLPRWWDTQPAGD